MKYADITYPDINNGLGCRVTLWVSGCDIRCHGCHNERLWDFECGKEFTEDTMAELIEIVKLPYISGLTVMGGEPCSERNAAKVAEIVKTVKEGTGKNIWVYTGYNYEDIKDRCKDIFDNADCIVDGPYIAGLRDTELPFRGSSNQRIIELNDTPPTFRK